MLHCEIAVEAEVVVAWRFVWVRLDVVTRAEECCCKSVTDHRLRLALYT